MNEKTIEKLQEDITNLEGTLENVSNQMQKLREALGRASYENAMLSMQQSYVHPWYKYSGE